MRNDAKHLTEQFQAVLRLVDLSDEQMTMLLMWRDRDEELAGLTAPPRSPEPDMLEEARL